jgi:hypothetical protein
MCGDRGRMTRKSGRRLGRAEGGPGQRRTGGVERRPMEYGEGLCEAVGWPVRGSGASRADLGAGEGRRRWGHGLYIGEGGGGARVRSFFPKFNDFRRWLPRVNRRYFFHRLI